MDGPRVAIIIPALNEEGSIAAVVRACCGYGMPIVVDDGSSDATAEVASREGVAVVSHAVNRGYDSAIESGFRRASELECAYAVTVDADGQHDPHIIGEIVMLLEAGADVVIGNRDKRPRVAEHCFALLTRLMYGIADPLCGMKGYRMAVYHDLGHFDSYGSIGTELALFGARNGYRIAQFPIVVRSREDTPRFGRSFKANMRIFRAMALFLRTLI